MDNSRREVPVYIGAGAPTPDSARDVNVVRGRQAALVAAGGRAKPGVIAGWLGQDDPSESGAGSWGDTGWDGNEPTR